jgi:hypothetical protein
MQESFVLLDPNDNVVARGTVSDATDGESGVLGTVDLSAMPDSMRAVFAQFEADVNNQVLSHLDELDDQIEAMQLRVQFADGSTARMHDLQIYPAQAGISFEVVGAAAARESA